MLLKQLVDDGAVYLDEKGEEEGFARRNLSSCFPADLNSQKDASEEPLTEAVSPALSMRQFFIYKP